jgi:mannosyl-3-phosphoglycerate phosphatase
MHHTNGEAIMPSRMTAWWPRSSEFTARLRQTHRRDRLASRSHASRIVLFSDPDTLRDEGNPGWAATRRAVRTVEDRGVAVVLCGNETRSELELIQSDLNLRDPFISENGGGLFVPHGYFPDRPGAGRATQNYHVVDFGKPYYQVAEALHEVAGELGVDVIGFSDMSIQDVAQDCGLSLAQARLSKLREYDEPFRMFDAEPATYSRICNALRRLDLRCFTHEAFHHATGVVDNARSVRMLASLYRQAYHGQVLTVGLARASSETCLLQAVDIPMVVQSDAVDAARLARKVPTARLISVNGPRGWCDAILQLVEDQRAVR